MEQQVRREGHLPLGDLLADLLEMVRHLDPIVGPPLREVQVTARLADVAGEDPGGRRDLAVPGPPGPMGMAVAAGALEKGGRRGRRIHPLLETLPRVLRRIGPGRTVELDRRQQQEEGQAHPLEHLPHEATPG